jgi:hypothetical protein
MCSYVPYVVQTKKTYVFLCALCGSNQKNVPYVVQIKSTQILRNYRHSSSHTKTFWRNP